jgi:hypothetical protein
MGFSQEWVQMILRCVKNVRFSVKLNGSLSDPLSPYLFLFCVEGFSALLRRAQLDRQLSGVSFGTGGPTVTHLLFADDSVVFLEASSACLAALKDILQKYEVSSGQWVNLNKSSIYFGKGCPEPMRALLKGVIGIGCEALSAKYPGLPTMVGRSKEGTFKYLTDNSRAKVKGLKGQGLSMQWAVLS